MPYTRTCRTRIVFYAFNSYVRITKTILWDLYSFYIGNSIVNLLVTCDCGLLVEPQKRKEFIILTWALTRSNKIILDILDMEQHCMS